MRIMRIAIQYFFRNLKPSICKKILDCNSHTTYRIIANEKSCLRFFGVDNSHQNVKLQELNPLPRSGIYLKFDCTRRMDTLFTTQSN